MINNNNYKFFDRNKSVNKTMLIATYLHSLTHQHQNPTIKHG
jgi:hypothetical protein